MAKKEQHQLNKDFEPILSVPMADMVEMRIREYLKKKALKPGDPLPKELELAEALGVSRNVVREALSRLRMLGMIESRKRRGMILTRPDILGAFERVLDPLMMDQNTLQDVFELRLVLEMGLADLLFIRKTEEDIEELSAILDKEVHKIQKPFRVKNEIAFHGKLYRMTGNDTFLRFQSMLLPVFEYVVAYETKMRGKAEVGKVTHRDLVEILKSGTPEDFRQGMKEHLKPHFDRLQHKSVGSKQ